MFLFIFLFSFFNGGNNVMTEWGSLVIGNSYRTRGSIFSTTPEEVKKQNSLKLSFPENIRVSSY